MPRKSDPSVYCKIAERFTTWCKNLLWFTIILKFKVFLNFERKAIKVKRWPITSTFSSVYSKEHCKGIFYFRDGQQLHLEIFFNGKGLFWNQIFAVLSEENKSDTSQHTEKASVTSVFTQNMELWEHLSRSNWKVTGMSWPVPRGFGKIWSQRGLGSTQ